MYLLGPVSRYLHNLVSSSLGLLLDYLRLNLCLTEHLGGVLLLLADGGQHIFQSLLAQSRLLRLIIGLLRSGSLKDGHLDNFRLIIIDGTLD